MIGSLFEILSLKFFCKLVRYLCDAFQVRPILLALQLELQLHVLQTNYEVTILHNGQLQKKLESYMRDRRRTIGALESEKETVIALRNRVLNFLI